MILKLKIVYHYLLTKYFSSVANRNDLEKMQNIRMKKLRRKVLMKSPFYRSFQDTPFNEIPIMTKQFMMKQFNEIVTQDIDRDTAIQVAIHSEKTRDFTPSINGITIGLSSGTSGNRGLFLVSPSERTRWAGVILAKVIEGSLFKQHKISLFLRANSNLYETVNSRKIKFNYHDLKKPFDILVKEINVSKPSILIAPALVLKSLAQYKEKGILRINPEKIYSCAEVLSVADKEYLSVIFNQNIHQIYQCTEGFLGITCHKGSLHLNEEYIYFEKQYLDKEKKRFIPIITDLVRVTQPIIRYRLDDILIESNKQCGCGNAAIVIDHIEGRCDDIILLPAKDDPNKLVLIFPDFLQRAVITAQTNIREYRLVQYNYNSIRVELLTDSFQHDCSTVLGCLLALFEDFNCLKPQIQFKEYVPQCSLIKFRRVVREFPMPESIL